MMTHPEQEGKHFVPNCRGLSRERGDYVSGKAAIVTLPHEDTNFP